MTHAQRADTIIASLSRPEFAGGAQTFSPRWLESLRPLLTLHLHLATEEVAAPRRKLVHKVQKVGSSAEFASVFHISAIHHCPYTGGTWEHELAEAARALELHPAPSSPCQTPTHSATVSTMPARSPETSPTS